MSIAFCLSSLGIDNLNEVDLICIDRHMEKWPESNSQFGYDNAAKGFHPRYDDNHRWNYLIEQTIKFDYSKVRFVSHVDAHAASTYFCSPFEKAVVLIAEGGTGIYHGEGCKLNIIDRIGYLGDTFQNSKKLAKRRDHFVNPSFLYDKISSHLGYDIFGAGQTMALAGFSHQFPFEPLIKIAPDRFDDFIINHDETVVGIKNVPSFNNADIKQLVSNPWVSLAYQAQSTLEEDITYLAKIAQEKTKETKLCLAGGAALNCVINQKLIESNLFEEIFIQPAASDEGIPLGCALLGYYSKGGKARFNMENAYLGPSNNPQALAKETKKWNLQSTVKTNKQIANLLANGKIIGRIFGQSEYGPRALGNRSILADPRSSDLKTHLNANIKRRETFRPFAPSCLEDNVPDYITSLRKSPFMIVAGTVSEKGKHIIPVVTHIDGSTRIQTVNRKQNLDYYELIEAFGDMTGCPVLTNTSFNDRNEPIVETYEDAINCFLKTGLDAVYCDGILIERTQKTPILNREENDKNIIAKVNKNYAQLIFRFCDDNKYITLAKELNAQD